MRTRSLGLTLLAVFALASAACTSGGGGSQAPTAPPDPCAGQTAGAAHTLPTDAKQYKIGVLADIGSLTDKNFNEYTNKGAQDGASAIGAATPAAVVPKDASEYKAKIQSFVDQKYDVIITVGFNLAGATTCAAQQNPGIKFIGVDQSPICVTEAGKLDTTFACKGAAKTLLPNYTSIAFKEDQAGYLAGIVAASVSKTGTIAAVGGTTLCGPCVRYIQGYELGAKSVNANVKVVIAYVTRDFSKAAFHDQAGGKTFAQSMLATNKDIDVIFQVAGETGNGVIDAACAANIWAIGVDVDQFLSYPAADKCILTSAEKSLVLSVSSDLKALAAGTLPAGDQTWGAAQDGIGVSDFHDKASQVPATVQGLIDTAFAAMKAGTLVTCPATGCGVGPK